MAYIVRATPVALDNSEAWRAASCLPSIEGFTLNTSTNTTLDGSDFLPGFCGHRYVITILEAIVSGLDQFDPRNYHDQVS